jgi:hypothetical protein
MRDVHDPRVVHDVPRQIGREKPDLTLTRIREGWERVHGSPTSARCG